MNKKIILAAVVMTASLNLISQEAVKELFTSPMNETPSLSASFAELRSDHFHTGLDYKTGGVTGKEVMSVADGYIYRVAVSPGGFGKALYVRHPSGYSTVYGHLDSFRPDIEEYVKKRQYEMRSFSVSLYPARNQFRVNQGEVIARSGNTGGSSGPHLHFEVRESSTEDPLNPLSFNMGINDRMRPVIEKIILYPLTPVSSVNKNSGSLALRTYSTGGGYMLQTSSVPQIYGQTGIGIKCWDTFDNSTNRCGIYSIEMQVDSSVVYSFKADRFSYSESRYINSHIDYKAKVLDNEYIHRAYLQPGNRLSMYGPLVNRGIISFNDGNDHSIKITVADAAGNKSSVNFIVHALAEQPVASAERSYSKIIPYGKASDFTADGIRIHFPSLALYDTLFLAYSVRNHSGFLSPVHTLHNPTVALHDPIRISLRPDTVIKGKEEKLCLASVDSNGKAFYAGGDYTYGFVSADVRSLGDYTVSIDTVPPTVKPSFTAGADLSGRKSFTITITDDFSGIKSYEALVDGVWALAEYDAKNNILIYRPEQPRLKENTLHRLELTVTDNRGNSSILKSEFKW